MYPIPFCNLPFCEAFPLPRQQFLMCVITAEVNVCQSDIISYVNSVDVLFTNFLTYEAIVL